MKGTGTVLLNDSLFLGTGMDDIPCQNQDVHCQHSLLVAGSVSEPDAMGSHLLP